MRKLGELSKALLDAVQSAWDEGEPATLDEVMRRSVTSRTVAKTGLAFLTRTHRVRIHDMIRVPHAKRPVARYAPELRSDPSEALPTNQEQGEAAQRLNDALSLWVQR